MIFLLFLQSEVADPKTALLVGVSMLIGILFKEFASILSAGGDWVEQFIRSDIERRKEKTSVRRKRKAQNEIEAEKLKKLTE